MTIKERLRLMAEVGKRNAARDKAFAKASKLPVRKRNHKKGGNRKNKK